MPEDPYAPFYDREVLARLEIEGRWSLAHGVEAARLTAQGVIDERTMIPAGLVPAWLCEGWPAPASQSRPSIIPPGRLAHGGTVNAEPPEAP